MAVLRVAFGTEQGGGATRRQVHDLADRAPEGFRSHVIGEPAPAFVQRDVRRIELQCALAAQVPAGPVVDNRTEKGTDLFSDQTQHRTSIQINPSIVLQLSWQNITR